MHGKRSFSLVNSDPDPKSWNLNVLPVYNWELKIQPITYYNFFLQLFTFTTQITITNIFVYEPIVIKTNLIC